MPKAISFVFWGTPKFAEIILDGLESKGFVPKLIIAGEDKPKGRHLVTTPPETKIWAEKRGIKTLQPKSLKDPEIINSIKKEAPQGIWDLFIVASYGKIMPKEILALPRKGTLNVHPSLLPKLRGPSPISDAILYEEETGVTIMLLDEEMDHGPIVAQEKIEIPDWPPENEILESNLAHVGGLLLAKTIIPWLNGEIKERGQEHGNATYSKKIKKEDAMINLKDNPEKNLRKIRAYGNTLNPYTYIKVNKRDIRLIIKKARIENGKLVIERVIPDGKKEMSLEDFKRGLHSEVEDI